MRNGGLEGIEAIVERQQRMLAEGDDQRLFLFAENRRVRLPRAHPSIADRTTPAPFSDCLRIDAVAARRALSGSLDYFVLLDGPPQSLWRYREEFAP